MRKLLLSTFIGLLTFSSPAQNKLIDSLINNLNNLKVDSLICKGYLRIADAYADSAYDKSLVYYNKALVLAENSRERTQVAYIYSRIGVMYYKKGELSSALINYNNALEIHKYMNNRTGIGQMLNDIGVIYKTWGKHDRALENYFKALKIFEDIGDDVNGALVSSSIGQIFYYRGEYEKSIPYFKKYFEVNKRTKTARAIAAGANNIASAYLELNRLDDALKYYINSMKIYDSLGYKIGVAIIKDNIGSLYIRKKQYHDALLFNSEASKTFEAIGNQSLLCVSLQCVGLAYFKLNQPDLAIINLNKSLKIALKLKQQETKKDVYETLSDVYAQKKEFDKALSFYKLYIVARDSLLNAETASKIETIQAKYESQKKEKNLVEVKQKLHNQRILGLLSAGIIVLFLFLTTIIIKENQQKKKTIKISNEQTKNLYQVISKTCQILSLARCEKLEISSIFKKSWSISSNKFTERLYIPFYNDRYLLIAFISNGLYVDNEDVIKLSIFDFFSTLKNNDPSISIKEQFNNFIEKESTWQNILNKENPINIDFWCYNINTGQQLYNGIVSAFHIDSNNHINDLSKKTNSWLSINKGDRLFFFTSPNLSPLILNEKDFFQNTISKTIANTLYIPFDEQKEILSNSLELMEAGNNNQLSISMFGFMI